MHNLAFDQDGLFCIVPHHLDAMLHGAVGQPEVAPSVVVKTEPSLDAGTTFTAHEALAVLVTSQNQLSDVDKRLLLAKLDAGKCISDAVMQFAPALATDMKAESRAATSSAHQPTPNAKPAGADDQHMAQFARNVSANNRLALTPSTVPSSVQAAPRVDTEAQPSMEPSVETTQKSMLPMNPTSRASAPIKLPDGVQPAVFESPKHRAAAWAKCQRSLDLGKPRPEYNGERGKRTEKCPDHIQAQLAGTHERQFYFNLWMSCGEKWGDVEIYEEHYWKKPAWIKMLKSGSLTLR